MKDSSSWWSRGSVSVREREPGGVELDGTGFVPMGGTKVLTISMERVLL